ncbi:UPF0688 protein C1orf174 homolog [Myiozetetes cayanensis]|uniref:UPF0688 protein C1orf174 homolog n=1 Tax=Myiozetetes cayanensis TaxID=478635 RepID=UPI002160A835|nr:UPF0688 protein C1orf174 homolog [Myiozetetes cayanensis]
MAAGGVVRGGRRSQPPGPAPPARPRRRRPGRGAKGSPATDPAQPAGEETETASPCLSHKVADERPSKRMKWEESSPKPELEGLACGSGNLAALGEMPKASDGDRGSEDPGDTNTFQQEKGESIPETNEGKQEEERDVSLEPRAVRLSSTPLKVGSGGYLHRHVFSEEESSCGSVLAEESGSEDTDRPRRPLQLEHSGFSDEDSNQPMPVHRFFGDFEPDLPAVALPSTTMSRREVRNLHFMAKEDEEEEEDVV